LQKQTRKGDSLLLSARKDLVPGRLFVEPLLQLRHADIREGLNERIVLLERRPLNEILVFVREDYATGKGVSAMAPLEVEEMPELALVVNPVLRSQGEGRSGLEFAFGWGGWDSGWGDRHCFRPLSLSSDTPSAA
jgi:hypothetical protein